MEIDILLADADKSLRELYGDYFTRKGWSIETAEDDIECAMKVRTLNPRFLIVDLDFFESDAAVTQSLSLASNDVLAIIVTGDDVPLHLSELSGVPVSHCFQKPYSFMALLECMNARPTPKQTKVSPEASVV